MVGLESMALSLAKTIVQKAAGAWIADRRTAEERKKELKELLTPWFRSTAPEQRFLDEAASELASFSHEFRGLDDGERAAALQAVRNTFERADLTDRALFAVDVDPTKLASRLRAGQPQAKTDAWLGEVGGAFYDAALDRCCKLYVRAVEQVPAFVGRSLAEMLNRLSDLPDQVAARVVNALGEAQAAVADSDGAVTMAGRPLEEMADPFDLEVHRPVQPEDAPPGLPLLPPYVPREHDQVLGQVVRAAAAGRSGIAVLVGGSSTGKTRAYWEALARLRNQDPPWRLWHPIDPSRPDAALAELAGIGPRTVVWLNEAQFYLEIAEGGLGERVAAGLRELLRDSARAPALILATVWPGFWDTLTARPPEGAPDPHAQARELLTGHDITVPAAFTPAQMGQLAGVGDVRMVLAARSAPDGEVIQFLAGAPELLARYRNASPAAAALIDAAMDARRLGAGLDLPRAFLEAAAPGYLTDDQWDGLGDDWLEQALAYTAKDAKGVRGPLTRIRPRPPRSRPARPGSRDGGEQPLAGPTGPTGGPVYRLADYLDQHGRQHRKSQIPPAGFWAAAADHLAPADQAALGDAADARGLYRDAAQLHKNAAGAGNLRAASHLSGRPSCLRDDARPVRWAVAHAVLDDPGAVAELLGKLPTDAQDQVAALLDRDPAARVSLDDPGGVARLLGSLRAANAQDQVAALLDRDPAARVSLDDPGGVALLLDSLWTADAHEQAAVLASRAAAHVSLAGPIGVADLLGSLRAADARDQVTALADRVAAHVPLDNPIGVARLLDSLREVGAEKQVTALADRAVAHVPLDDEFTMSYLLEYLSRVGAEKQATALTDRAVAHVPLDDTIGVARLLQGLWEVGAQDQVTALADRAIPRVSLDDPRAVAALLGSLREAYARDQVTALLDRDPAARVSVDNPRAAVWLLESLLEVGAGKQATVLADRAAAHARLDDPNVVILLGVLWNTGAQDQVTALLDRDPAARVTLDDPDAVSALLKILLKAGAHDQITALLRRDPAARVSLDARRSSEVWPIPALSLLESLQEAGAHEQAAALVDRLPGAGMFRLFCLQEDHRSRFRFGRETDGRPAEPWDWDDLD